MQQIYVQFDQHSLSVRIVENVRSTGSMIRRAQYEVG
jgi:hypothetical protein